MRRAMQAAVSAYIRREPDSALLLVDIGEWAFRELIAAFPDRVKNIGIFEDGIVSVAAGMALAGVVPIVYGISPFIAQRALEQLKLDFAYQRLGGNFITTGASYDFATLGYSHYCAEDVATLMTLPGFEVVTPGTPAQFTSLFATCVSDGRPTYYRLSDYCSRTEIPVEYGRAAVVRTGSRGTVIVCAEMLDAVLDATCGLDVTVLYYATAQPFDRETLVSYMTGDDLVICHPFYEGTFAADIIGAVGSGVHITELAVPREILRCYGTKAEIDERLGLDAASIRKRLPAAWSD